MALFPRSRGRVTRPDTDHVLKDLNTTLVHAHADRFFPSLRQWKYLGSVLSASEQRLLRIAGGIAVVSLCIFAIIAWTRHVAIVPVPGGDYTEVVVGSPAFPNPLYLSGNDVDADIKRLVYSGLLAQQQDGTLVPDLAESYEVSEDGKQYTIHLRDGLTWHDGEPLTVDDVLFTYSLIQNDAYRSAWYRAAKNVKVERVDDATIRFTGQTSVAQELLLVGVMPTHVWQNVMPNNMPLAEYTLKPIGAGPYRFSSLIRDKNGAIRSYTVQRFPDAAIPALLNTITLRFVTDQDAAVQAILAKQADGIGFLPPVIASRVAVRPDLQKYQLQLPQSVALYFNQKKEPVLADQSVRDALVIATPREEIRDALAGDGAQLIESPLLPGMDGYDAKLQQDAFNPDKAKKVLESAGYTMHGTSTVREKAGKSAKKGTAATASATLSFSLTFVDRSDMRAIAERVQQAWAAVGVQVDLQGVSADAMQKTILPKHDYAVLLFGEVFGADRSLAPFWHSSQAVDGGSNLALYANATVDAALDSARAATAPDARGKAQATAVKQIVKDAPAIFLYAPTTPYFVTKSIQGVVGGFIATPDARLQDVRDWYTKTARRWR